MQAGADSNRPAQKCRGNESSVTENTEAAGRDVTQAKDQEEKQSESVRKWKRLYERKGWWSSWAGEYVSTVRPHLQETRKLAPAQN